MLRSIFVVIFLFLISTSNSAFHPIKDLAIYYEAVKTIFNPNQKCIFLCDASCSLSSYKARVVYDIIFKTPGTPVQTCIQQLSKFYESRCVKSTVTCLAKTLLNAHCTYEIEGRQVDTKNDPCLLLAFNNTYVTSCDDTLLGEAFFVTFCKTPLGK